MEDCDLIGAQIIEMHTIKIQKLIVLIARTKLLRKSKVKKHVIVKNIHDSPWFHQLFCFYEFIVEKIVHSQFGLS